MEIRVPCTSSSWSPPRYEPNDRRDADARAPRFYRAAVPARGQVSATPTPTPTDTVTMAAASHTASTVVQPRFQKVLTSASLTSLLARKNPGKFSSAMLQAAAAPGPPRIGFTYFPPMNCNPTIIAPEPSKAKMKFTAPSAPLPAYFNWADNRNVAASKNWGVRDAATLGSYVCPPPNQLACGSCWAVASASVMSDRWAIFTQGPNPRLSATELLGCVSDGSSIKGVDVRFDNIDGCNGGIPAGAAEMMAKVGIVTSDCVSYAWCEKNNVCRGESSGPGGDPGRFLNTTVVPACANLKQCLSCGAGGCTSRDVAAPRVYKARRYGANAFTYPLTNPNVPRVEKKTTMRNGISFSVPVVNAATSAAISLTNVTDIRNELFANGPVVGAMAVFADFQAGCGPSGDDWAPTKNVYCNVQGSGRKPYERTRYAGVEDNLTGYHAVSIVGWGVENDVDDWEKPGAKIAVPYWIVRNSWSPEWNAKCRVNNGAFGMPGFFKIAVTNTSKRINTQIYLDRSDNGALGGATAFEPDVARALPPPVSSPAPLAPPAPPVPPHAQPVCPPSPACPPLPACPPPPAPKVCPPLPACPPPPAPKVCPPLPAQKVCPPPPAPKVCPPPPACPPAPTCPPAPRCALPPALGGDLHDTSPESDAENAWAVAVADDDVIGDTCAATARSSTTLYIVLGVGIPILVLAAVLAAIYIRCHGCKKKGGGDAPPVPTGRSSGSTPMKIGAPTSSSHYF